MATAAPSTSETENGEELVLITPNLDLEGYAANYAGNTRIDRLIFIGDRCPPLRTEAYKAAVKELLTTTNTTRYLAVCHKLRRAQEEAGLPLDPVDEEWVAVTDRQAHIRADKLDQELKTYKNNHIKESIRMGHNDMGDHYYKRGELDKALRSYKIARDYCTTTKHVVTLCFNVIKVLLEMKSPDSVMEYVRRAENTPDIVSDPLTVSKLKCCGGLAELANSNYLAAAKSFVSTSFDIGTSFNEVLSAQDIGTYGGLTALASFDRAALKADVIDNQQFKQFLELAPEVRELINAFYASRYAECLKYLDQLRPDLLLDIHLHLHVNALFAQIRKKALIQYCSPFISVDLSKMAAAFKTDVPSLETDLIALIQDGCIQARIDSHNKVLLARQTDPRAAVFEQALQAGAQHHQRTMATILRANMLRADFYVKE